MHDIAYKHFTPDGVQSLQNLPPTMVEMELDGKQILDFVRGNVYSPLKKQSSLIQQKGSFYG